MGGAVGLKGTAEVNYLTINCNKSSILTCIYTYLLSPSLPSIITEEASISHSARYQGVEDDWDVIHVLQRALFENPKQSMKLHYGQCAILGFLLIDRKEPVRNVIK